MLIKFAHFDGDGGRGERLNGRTVHSDPERLRRPWTTTRTTTTLRQWGPRHCEATSVPCNCCFNCCLFFSSCCSDKTHYGWLRLWLTKHQKSISSIPTSCVISSCFWMLALWQSTLFDSVVILLIITITFIFNTKLVMSMRQVAVHFNNTAAWSNWSHDIIR